MVFRPLDRKSRLARQIHRFDTRIAALDASLDELVAGHAETDLVRSHIQRLAMARQRAQAQLDSLQPSVPSLSVMVPTTGW